MHFKRVSQLWKSRCVCLVNHQNTTINGIVVVPKPIRCAKQRKIVKLMISLTQTGSHWDPLWLCANVAKHMFSLFGKQHCRKTYAHTQCVLCSNFVVRTKFTCIWIFVVQPQHAYGSNANVYLHWLCMGVVLIFSLLCLSYLKQRRKF